MSATPSVTYQQISILAKRMLLAGEEPTVDNLFKLLQEQGTLEDVAKHFAKWSEEHADELQKVRSHIKNIDPETAERMQELQNSLSLVRATMESTIDGILITDLDGKLVDWNKRFLEISGLPQELLEQGDEQASIDFIFDKIEKPQELAALMLYLHKHPEEKGGMGETYFKDGRIFERYSQPHRVGDEIVGRVWSFRDVTERRKAEDELRLRNRAVEASTHGIIITDNGTEQKILYVNPAFEKITGYTQDEIMGQSYKLLQRNDQDQAELQSLRLALKEQREEKAVLRSYRKDGTMFWNEMYVAPVPDTSGRINHFVGIINDITERKAMEAQLIHQATHDALTGLPNRILLQDRINQAILYSRRSNSIAIILFLDIDRFKLVNDSLGHKMGDELLCAVSQRLSSCVRDTDTVSRIGGDEYVIILSPLQRVEDGISITQKIMETLHKSFQVEERELNITASIGISCYPRDGIDAETLVKNSDTAMYQAKDNGRDNFQFFTDEMNRQVSQRLSLQNNLHRAIERQEFILHYQPIINLHSGSVTSLEALIRWDHPDQGPISPLEFIPLAEETGLIIPIGEWVLETACKQCRAWNNMGMPLLQISVNVSGRQLKNTDFVETVAQTVAKTGLDPKNLVLELTESILMDNNKETIDKLYQLKEMGCILAIDDFGTGYSSLSYLKQLPVDKLKIDRTFVQDVSTDPDDAAITLAIIAMSKSLNLKVVAEGTQTRQDLEFLRGYQCDEVQGFYFSKPIDAESATNLLRENYGLLGKGDRAKY